MSSCIDGLHDEKVLPINFHMLLPVFVCLILKNEILNLNVTLINDLKTMKTLETIMSRWHQLRMSIDM